jgi:hypothetical protein
MNTLDQLADRVCLVYVRPLTWDIRVTSSLELNYTMENIFAHYGIDWFAMALSLYGAYLLGDKKKIGFVIFAISNIVWVVLGAFFMSSYGMAIGNFLFLLINVRGFIEWNKQDFEAESGALKIE